MKEPIPVARPADQFTRVAAIKPPGGEKLIEFIIPPDMVELEATHYLVYLVNGQELVSIEAAETLMAAQWVASEFIMNNLNKQTALRH